MPTSLPVVAKLRDFVENELGDTHRRRRRPPLPRHRLAGHHRSRRRRQIRHRRARAEPLCPARDLGREDRLLPAGRCDRRTRYPRSPAARTSAPSTRSTRCASRRRRASCRSATSSSARRCRRSPRSAAMNGLYSMSVAANLEPGVDRRPEDRADQAVGAGADQGRHHPGRRPYRLWRRRRADRPRPTPSSARPFVVALALIALILLLEYNSFWQVFVTISTVGHVAGRRDARAGDHAARRSR